MTAEAYDWDEIVGGLNQYLRLRSIPIGMKLFETRRRDGGDSEDPPAQGQAHHRSDRGPGPSARLDRRDHHGGPGRRAVRRR